MALPHTTTQDGVTVITHDNGTTVRQHKIAYDTRVSFSNSGPDVMWIRQGGLGANVSVVGLDQDELDALIAALRKEGLV